MPPKKGGPLAVSVYAGNTGDRTTVADQIEKLRKECGLQRVVRVADRGMLTQPQIETLRAHSGLGWITALTSTAIRELVAQGALCWTGRIWPRSAPIIRRSG